MKAGNKGSKLISPKYCTLVFTLSGIQEVKFPNEQCVRGGRGRAVHM